MAEIKISDVKKKIDSLLGQIKTSALKVVQVEAVRSIQKNFEVGGRPRWIPSKKKGRLKGTNTLRVTGTLSQVSAVRNDSDGTVTFTTNPGARAYARIHQEGGVINRKAGTQARRTKRDGRSVFASKNRDTGKAKKVDISFYKPYQIRIPARPYMVIPDEDLPQIMNQVANAIKRAL